MVLTEKERIEKNREKFNKRISKMLQSFGIVIQKKKITYISDISRISKNKEFTAIFKSEDNK